MMLVIVLALVEAICEGSYQQDSFHQQFPSGRKEASGLTDFLKRGG